MLSLNSEFNTICRKIEELKQEHDKTSSLLSDLEKENQSIRSKTESQKKQTENLENEAITYEKNTAALQKQLLSKEFSLEMGNASKNSLNLLLSEKQSENAVKKEEFSRYQDQLIDISKMFQEQVEKLDSKKVNEEINKKTSDLNEQVF